MALNIKGNYVKKSQIGISVPESMNGNVENNTIIGGSIGVEVRNSPTIFQMLREGYPEELLPNLLKELKLLADDEKTTEEKYQTTLQDSGISKWLTPGTNIMEFLTAALNFIDSLGKN